MKKPIFILIMILAPMMSFSQDPVDILRKSYRKCQSVQNGYYDMTFYMEYMSGDTSPVFQYKCYFRKLADDSIYSSAFHLSTVYADGNVVDKMYTGNEYLWYSEGDSSGTIMRKPEWTSQIKSYAQQNFYSVLTNRKSHPLLNEEQLGKDSIYIFKFIGEEEINDHSCYHVQVNELPENEPGDGFQTLRQEYQFWIDKQDYIPFQYTIAFDMMMDNDTMYQFERYTLFDYELDLQDIDKYISLTSVPSFIKLEEYKPYEPPPLLPADTIAPVWKLPDLKGDSLSLADLKGSIVLIDFFYKSCYPCMQALPALEQLHEKYKDQPVRIIGIDPFDKPEEGIADFLAKRGVTYTVLLGGREVARTYRVSGYPTMYLIDKEGKVITTQVGFGEGIDALLEEKINEVLGR